MGNPAMSNLQGHEALKALVACNVHQKGSAVFVREERGFLLPSLLSFSSHNRVTHSCQ